MIETNKELRWIRILLAIIALPVLVIILKALKAIFIPLIIAIFLSFVFAPLTAYLKKRHIPMILILLLTLVIIGVFFFLVIMVVYAAANSLVSGIPNYQASFSRLVTQAVEYFSGYATKWEFTTDQLSLINISQFLTSGFVSIPSMIKNTMNTFIGVFWNLFLILIFMIFILLESDKLQNRLKKVMTDEDKQTTYYAISNIQLQLQKYLTVKSLISLATAIVGMAIMLAYGVDFVLVCGILLFVLNFIPNIGSIIATAVPITICALQGGFDFRLFSFSLLMIGTQMLFGNIIEPRVQGNRLNLTPIMVLISLIFWGWLWGVVGMLISVPLTSALNIIIKQVDSKNIFSAIFSSE